MPTFGSGVKKAIISTIISVIAFTLLKIIAEMYPKYDTLVAVFILLSLIGVLEIIENAKYWGIGYTIGFILGLFFIKPLLDESEYTLLILFIGIILGQKLWRKFSR